MTYFLTQATSQDGLRISSVSFIAFCVETGRFPNYRTRGEGTDNFPSALSFVPDGLISINV